MGALLDLALEAEPSPLSTDARECAQRIGEALRMLRKTPARQSACVAGEERGGIIPVTVVVCTPEGFVTGDLEIPKDRWDPWLFLRFLEEHDRGSAS